MKKLPLFLLSIVLFTVGCHFDLSAQEKKDTVKASAEVFFIVEEMPEFPGGDIALKEYLTHSLQYPKEAKEKGIQGKVYVNFVVDTLGNVSQSRIARGVDPILDREALRVIKALPKWKPGKQRGKSINVSYTVPIEFKIDSLKNSSIAIKDLIVEPISKHNHPD